MLCDRIIYYSENINFLDFQYVCLCIVYREIYIIKYIYLKISQCFIDFMKIFEFYYKGLKFKRK